MLSGRLMGIEDVLKCHLAVTLKLLLVHARTVGIAHYELAVTEARNMHYNKQKHCTAVMPMVCEVYFMTAFWAQRMAVNSFQSYGVSVHLTTKVVTHHSLSLKLRHFYAW